MKYKKWTQEELDILKNFYKEEKSLISVRLPGRSMGQIRARAKMLGLSKIQNRYLYDEDKTICEKVLSHGGYNLRVVRETINEFKTKGYILRTLNSYASRFSNFNYLINGVGFYACSKQCIQVYKELCVKLVS